MKIILEMHSNDIYLIWYVKYLTHVTHLPTLIDMNYYMSIPTYLLLL